MTKKDYILIADALYTAGSNLREVMNCETVGIVAREYEKQVKRFLKLDNKLFDDNKFDEYIRGLTR